MKIKGSELEINIKIKEGKYYYYQKKPDKEEEYFGNTIKLPKDIGPRDDIRKHIIDLIKNYVTPNTYQEDGIIVFYSQQMLELEKELQIQQDNQIQENNYDEFFVNGYISEDNKYYKVAYRNNTIEKEYEVMKGKIKNFCRLSDFSQETMNNFIMDIKVKESDKKWVDYHLEGNKDEIVQKIINNDLAWNESNLKDFIYKFIYDNSADHTKQGVIGGYESWDNIKPIKKKDMRNIEELTNYFKNCLTPEHHSVIKSLILIPFHIILRKDANYAARKIVKFVVLHGAPSAFKNGIVNIVRNMFDFHNTIPIDAGGTPNTYAALRNSINNNLGIIMCDESNSVFLDEDRKFQSQTDNSVENLLKGVFQYEMPVVSGEKRGQIERQYFRGTPVFIWNDDFKVTEALKDRCIVTEFPESHNTEYTNLFNVVKFKEDLLYFGQVFAWCLASNWKKGMKLREEREYEDLINKVLKLMQEYNIDTQFLIDQKIIEHKSSIDIKQSFFDTMRYKIFDYRTFYNYVDGNNISHDILDKVDGSLFIEPTSKSVYIHKRRFINYIRSHIAKDGGLTESQIINFFDFEYDEKKKTYIWRKSNRDVLKMKTDVFFTEIHRIDNDGNENESAPKKIQQSRIL